MGAPFFLRLVSRAVKEGFGTRIGESVYPYLFFFLDSGKRGGCECPSTEKGVSFPGREEDFCSFSGSVSAVFGEAPHFPSRSHSFLRVSIFRLLKSLLFFKWTRRGSWNFFPRETFGGYKPFSDIGEREDFLVDLRAAQARIFLSRYR